MFRVCPRLHSWDTADPGFEPYTDVIISVVNVTKEKYEVPQGAATRVRAAELGKASWRKEPSS